MLFKAGGGGEARHKALTISRQAMHSPLRTVRLYDRHNDEASLDKYEAEKQIAEAANGQLL